MRSEVVPAPQDLIVRSFSNKVNFKRADRGGIPLLFSVVLRSRFETCNAALVAADADPIGGSVTTAQAVSCGRISRQSPKYRVARPICSILPRATISYSVLE
jgi:hypothetical protein